ncbi:BTAD domain-containing putative transcriptional regulator [Kribbella sp. NPDC048915]|uniref:AfsR/SARP family transcriptional regulator n=1 Tax=Kribbella sp. NPDC048915 TaxID=3155148 RepID=UPI0033F4C473
MRTSVACEVQLQLLGDWLLTTRNDNPDPARIKLPSGPQHLIALLALHRRCPRTQAAATLWPDCTDNVASARLRAVLWRLHHRHSSVPQLLEVDDDSLALASNVEVDAQRLRTSAEQLIHSAELTDDMVDHAAPAVLHSAELLPGWYDDWVLAARERLQFLRLGALDALAAYRRGQRRNHEALQAARAATAIEPLHESAHRVIVQTHLDDGDIVEAVRHYEQYRAMLDRELGLPPSDLFKALVEPYQVATPRQFARLR